ncbi:hypothetical protein Bca101_029830 [Brassica carinata]
MPCRRNGEEELQPVVLQILKSFPKAFWKSSLDDLPFSKGSDTASGLGHCFSAQTLLQRSDIASSPIHCFSSTTMLPVVLCLQSSLLPSGSHQ